MSKEKLPATNKFDENVSDLESRIDDLKNQIKAIEVQLNPFEQSLRNAIVDLLIEEKELTILYKQQKIAKKQKRLEQKKRGKNYKEPVGLKIVKKETSVFDSTDQKEKKRLYREAMLYVHPDRFSLKEDNEDLATEITTKLIQIYQAGTLEELQAYHAHIFGGNTQMKLENIDIKINTTIDKNVYLKKEIKRLEKELKELLERYTYKVLIEYENPMLFVDELKEYYNDRIFKLKKRTRTK
ncbi:hypothetical protein C7447_103109 [Tenacibaculum adriaticum]|uniref:J domain-containing protein n=1 Tax=Tenacibaculum adriaticum TaxID=413713 RepID=A0A5S5DPT0_9FLAO|nr:hypothetical protein [Tenacibaculum adriaticum]TYP97943.1 hypothetical protein C7447_103109 [Tenacibaculum adriaticum]